MKLCDLLFMLMKQMLTAKNDERAMVPLLELSSIAFLEKLYVDAETPENSKMLAKLLLLTIAQRSRKAGRKEEAVKALLGLNIVCIDNHACENVEPECKCCRCVMKSIYDDMDPTINDTCIYWDYKCIRFLAWLVENDENLSPHSSETMEDAFNMFRCAFFMSSFMQLYDGHLRLDALNRLLDNFINITVDAYNAMNPKYDGYIDRCFLQEHQTRALHIRTVLQKKMTLVDESKKDVIHQMLVRVHDLDMMLCPN